MGVLRTVPGKDADVIEDQYEVSSDEESTVESSPSSSTVTEEIDLADVIFPVTRPSRSQRIRTSMPSPAPRMSACVGQRRARRMANTRHLLDLSDGDTDTDIFQSGPGIFSQIMNSNIQTEFWDALLNTEDSSCFKCDEYLKTRKNTWDMKGQQISGEKAFQQLNAHQRFVLKRYYSLGFLHFMDNEIVSLFAESPENVYVSPELTSFERLILHAVAGYYQLRSFSSKESPCSNKRVAYVTNNQNTFCLPTCLLAEQLRKMKEVDKR